MGLRKVRNEAMVEACRKLYFKYDGCEHRRIEAEMRKGGWPKFSRRILTNEYRNGNIRRLGWINEFGWKEMLKAKAEPKPGRAAKNNGSFAAWLELAPGRLKWTARHFVFICEQLRKITSGETKRLMLFVPPRHGKSELVTVRYALWRLMREPGMNIIIGCYNQKLANRFSRKIKKLANTRVQISRSRHASEEWETAAGGSVKAVGVGAGITGFGGHLVIIDDPVKSRAVANSRTFRDKTWDWYKDDIHTRLEPGAAVVLIQTRWHDDDLAGRLLKDMEDGGEHWTVVRLPALAEEADPLDRSEGETLWPERYDRDELLATKRRLGSWSFASLYQQRPVPEGGTLFKHNWFKNIVSKPPAGLRWARGYDLAVSLKDSADYTASARCAIDKKTGTLYIAEVFRKRIEYPEQRKFVIERMMAEPDTRHGIELALHGKALMQELRRDPRIRGRVLRGVKVDGDKLLRAEAWSCFAEEGKVVLVNGSWINDFIDEACRFTGRGDAHDDQVDAVSLAVQMLRENKKGVTFFD